MRFNPWFGLWRRNVAKLQKNRKLIVAAISIFSRLKMILEIKANKNKG